MSQIIRINNDLDLDFICKDVFFVEKEDHGGLFEKAIVANGSKKFERFVKSAITMKANKLVFQCR